MTNFASEDDVSLANKSTKNNPSQSQILKKKQGCLDAFLQQKENNNQQNIEYEVPFLPFVSPMAPIPPAFRPEFPLYDHQRRSLYRMLSIEAKDEEYMKFNFGKLDYFSKGGCLADAIGMGKTATMLGLIVSEPLEEKETIGANLVIAPSHLLGQWKNEVTKFIQDNEEITIVIGLEAFEALKPDQIHNRMLVLVSVDEVLQTQTVYYSYGKIYATNPKKAGGGFSFFGEKKKKIDPLKLSEEKIQKFQSAAKYVHKAYEGTIWTSKFFFPLKKWRRVIFEEVQDLVLPGKKAYDCFIQVTRSAWNVWLVTATPFPNLKESIYANNQLLGFKRLRLEPKSEFFEKIKKKLYLRNCLQGIQDISMTGTVNTTPETTETTESTSSGTTPTGTGTTTPGTGIGTGIGIGIGTGTGTGTGISKIKIEEKYLCVPLHSKELNVYQMEMLFGENSTTSSGKSTSDSSTSTWWSEAFLSARQSCVHVGISDRILDRVPVDKKSKKKNNNNKKKKKKKNNNNNNKEEEEDDFEEEVLTTQAKDTRHVISKISQVKTPQEIFLQEKAFCQKTKYFSQEKLNEMKQIQEATKNTIEILKRIENQLLVYHGRSIAEAFEKIDENQEDENQKTTEILFSKGFRILQRHADETTYGGEFDDVLLFEKHEIKDYLLKYWFNSELVRKFRIIMETNLQENTKAIELIQRKIVLLEKCLTGTTTSTGNGTTTSVPYYGSKIACLIQYLLRLQEEKKKKNVLL
jgi:hypothetical protein